MPTVKVTVLRDDEPSQGHRVTLEVSGVSHGMLGPESTDSGGVAEFDVDDGEEGKVYVDGSYEADWGSYSRTDITVNL
jgi:hypothetical protein